MGRCACGDEVHGGRLCARCLAKVAQTQWPRPVNPTAVYFLQGIVQQNPVRQASIASRRGDKEERMAKIIATYSPCCGIFHVGDAEEGIMHCALPHDRKVVKLVDAAIEAELLAALEMCLDFCQGQAGSYAHDCVIAASAAVDNAKTH